MHSDNQLIRKIKKKNDRGAADKLLGGRQTVEKT